MFTLLNEEANQVLNKIKFGNQDERLGGILSLVDEKVNISLEELQPVLYAVMEKQEDINDMIWAAIALSIHGDRSIQLRDWLLNTLIDFTKNHDMMSPIGLLERSMARGLSLFKGDEIVSNGLIEALKNCSEQDISKSVINPIIRAIGSVGHESAIDFLKYWSSKGNRTAKVGLINYGATWKELGEKIENFKEYSILIEEEAKVLEKLENEIKREFSTNANYKQRDFKEENKHIIYLDLRESGLKVLPEELKKLAFLRELRLNENKSINLPNWLGELNSLEILQLNNCELKQFPENIKKITNLKELYLHLDNIKNIPNWISDLKYLEKLSLNRNWLKSVPVSIGKLTNLKELVLKNNYIKELPNSIFELQSLKKLDINGNPLKAKTKNILELLREKGIEVIHHSKEWS